MECHGEGPHGESTLRRASQVEAIRRSADQYGAPRFLQETTELAADVLFQVIDGQIERGAGIRIVGPQCVS